MENRAKIVEQIIGGIRQYCGPKFGISVRISGEEYIEGGLQLDETTQMAQRFEKAGADAINVSNATYALLINLWSLISIRKVGRSI